MKKRLNLTLMLLLLTLLTGVTGASARSAEADTTATARPSREARRLERKALQQAIDSMQYAEAYAALSDTAFTLEAQQVVFKHGERAYVTPSTNFVAVADGHATVQVAFNVPVLGPNGIGGVTVEGMVTNYQLRTDRRGNLIMSMTVMGAAISARLSITLCRGTNKASIDIVPNFSSNRLSLEGVVLPPDKSCVYKGRSI